ncbi:hypothetical protein FHX82_005160 [Amycolatopsis bartoniae]|uniref:Uncharacterized protein n=1 Tax=Amycolatopsis bartoniae TaxID=941986 RepID=A0A8H9MB41_9PSEU|nr:hypothetical protein [Amycolatopsis bartoniae]MBB2938084.1 hypothetical protein [Amycolatopsis bartoniae]TVT01245.1 hypothetical protein FNH07_29745 [Amycolatopsis bartoniae]GHF32568.1 hypothetical protein GCM10017566_01430 [Amycolatopsis bartoniae]
MSAKTKQDAAAGRTGDTSGEGRRINLPLLGEVKVPPPRQLAYLGSIATLTALEVIEWPIGLALAAGHILVSDSRNRVAKGVGEALEEA